MDSIALVLQREYGGTPVRLVRTAEEALEASEDGLRERIADYFMTDYHLSSLEAALQVAPDTGDWHGELRYLINEARTRYQIEKEWTPTPVEEQRRRVADAAN